MKEHNVDVKGKVATQITTSKHFYDFFVSQNSSEYYPFLFPATTPATMATTNPIAIRLIPVSFHIT